MNYLLYIRLLIYLIMDFGYIYLREHESYDIYNCYKLGKTVNIPERENTYITGEIKKGNFIMILKVKINEVDLIEQKLKNYFIKINFYVDGGTEFFNKSILGEIEKYLSQNNIYFVKLKKEEIDELKRNYREKNNLNNNRELNKNNDIIEDQNIDENIDENNQIISNDVNIIKKVPHKYQEIIINEVIKYFNKENKGILNIPCGVGKTLLSLWITERLYCNNKIIIGVPNIELLEQWESDVIDIFPNHKIFKVQSGIKINSIENMIKDNMKIIILTTYSSAFKIKKCSNCYFDIKICDEAHHLTSNNMDINDETKNFVEFLKINSNKQLALTATLKDIENLDNNDKIVSNKNEDFFGKVILKYSLLWGINKNIICDYQIQTLIYNEQLINEYLDDFGLNNSNDIRLFLTSYTSLKSIYVKNAHHLLIYSNNKENSKKIIYYINELIKKKIFKSDNLFFSDYNSEMKKEQRINIINNYNNNQFGIISCVYCLGEGYSNVLIDGVIFSENMSSNIRIVQSAMRSNRKNSNEPNKISKIILPILNKDNWIDDKDNNDLQKIKEIIYQMSLEDETIEHKIKAYEINIKKSNDNIENLNFANTYGELNENINKEILIKSIDRVKLGITYDKAKKINIENKIKNKMEYFKLCEKNIKLPKDPEIFFGQQFKNWIDYLGIPKIYYEIEECKYKVNEYIKKNNIKIDNIYDNDKICTELCKYDNNFPPDGLWVDYYLDDKINNLGEIIKSNINKKKKYSSLI